jgi:hypothetical protein
MSSSPPAEGEVIANAVTQVRSGRSADALRTLAAYRERFPRGAFALEADLAELQAKLQLNDLAGALATVDRLDRAGVAPPRARELRVLHAELLERNGKCHEALTLFVPNPEDEAGLTERIVRGEMRCLIELGRDREAEALSKRYPREAPQGGVIEKATKKGEERGP